ncbi:hypothetical protein [Streptomyces sp. NPDC020667]|uniref:hypothetical protein n=1 Tax=Streptomyces sp. NPDC020667 TaxID=3154895 RepID=UPI0033D4B9EE
MTVLVAIAAVALGAVLIIGDKGKKDDGPGNGPSAGPSPSFSLPSGLPSELPTRLPSRLPTSLPSGWPSGLPTSLPSGLPTELLPLPLDGREGQAVERAGVVTGPERPGCPARS